MGNVVTNDRDGIFSGSGTSYNTIDNNTVTGNEYGITLDLSTGETILRNEVSGNRQGGITVGFSALPVIRDNHVAGNARSGSYGGIYLESTTGARVFHNAIVGNTIQAHDAGTNSSDDGYPSGGNYWSDYTGVDNCSGPNQNTCPSPDGIGDTPYSFPASSRDRYPLMASPTTQPTPPSVPWNVRAVPSDRAVALTWSAPLDDGGSSITNYRIYGGTASGSEAFLIQLGNVTTYAVGGLSNGVTYYYQVSAVNAVGDGARATEAQATPASPANQPPRCGVMTPASGDRVSGTYPVTGTSNDPDGSVTRVEVRVDGGTWQNATGTNPWRYDWDTRQAASGAHTIHARSFDGTTYSSVVDVDVTVDNGLPPPPSGFGEGWFWGLLGLLVLVSVLLVFVLLRERRTKRPPEPRP